MFFPRITKQTAYILSTTFWINFHPWKNDIVITRNTILVLLEILINNNSEEKKEFRAIYSGKKIVP